MKDVLAPGLLLVLLVLFIAPGLVVAQRLHQRFGLRTLYAVPVAALAGCVLGYATFWVYVAGPGVGRALSYVLLAGELAAAGWLIANAAGRTLLRNLDVIAPLTLLFFVAMVFSGSLYGCVGADGIQCHVAGYPMDNVIPMMVADNVAAGNPAKPLGGDWQGSDRPPMQTGVVLVQGLLTMKPLSGQLGYQLMSTLLQCLWVVAIWVAGRRLGLTRNRILALLALCAGTCFFFFNSVFVWPKLLAASLALVGLLLVVAEPPRRLYWGLAAAMFGCGYLAHSSVVFTLIPVALVLLSRRFRPPVRVLAVAVGVGLSLLVPWTLYQRFIDPPGNRLLKWHLGGAIPVDSRGVVETIVEAYRSTPLGTLVSYKVENLKIVIGYEPWITGGGGGLLQTLRADEFFVTAVGLGLMHLGWLSLALPAVRRRLRSGPLDLGLIRLFLGVAVAALLLWCLLLFLPGTTVIHAGSYLTMMLFFVGLGAIIVSAFPRVVVAGLVALQVLYFAVVWQFDVMRRGTINGTWLLWLFVGLAGLVATAVLIARLPEPVDEAPVEVDAEGEVVDDGSPSMTPASA